MQNSFLKLFKIIVQFIIDLFGFFRNRKLEEQQINEKMHEEIVKDLKNKYDNVDKELDREKSKNVQDRINNLFK
jgi:predicted S18 family serine protease